MSVPKYAKRYLISGRVQGVGFRSFAEKTATSIGVSGYARNLDDGRVEVYAVGTSEQLAELAGHLWRGPRMAEVRTLEQEEAGVRKRAGFHIE